MFAWPRLRSVELAGVLASFRLPWIALSEAGKFSRFSRRERLSVSDSPFRRESRENFPGSEREVHGSRKPAKTPASSTLRKRSHANKSQTPKKPPTIVRTALVVHARVTQIRKESLPSWQRSEQSVSNCMRHRKTGGNFPATDRADPGNREPSQTRETSAQRKRSPSNKPLTSNHHASVRQGHSLWLQVEPVHHSHAA